ncbi:hypothetical protein PRUB_a2037 [Pseudoalteromonas rubra]|uniref:Uncharacterized protein n=1 Tax=Pseudoalteromonas rubra TaxID=43658 RepID=A0A8T0CEK1_9GAMM|nr:hypothetical protein [Pseudoalteromonas rubra]KAF7788930.1 hypothetical protein PRUB_a2037 [Pseudoalteromonas rubra]
MDIQVHPGSASVSKSVSHAQVRNNSDRASESKVSVDMQNRDEIDTVPPLLSQELDEEAGQYKEDNPVFKEDYEELEKAMALIQAFIRKLQAQLSKLMQSVQQRRLQVQEHEEAEVLSDAVLVEHIGLKQYRDSAKVDEIALLEQQLSEYKQLEADIRVNMIKMILAERERLEELKRKGKL